MTNLVTLKHEAQAANRQFLMRQRTRGDFRVIGPMLSIPLAFVGVGNIQIGLRDGTPLSIVLGVALASVTLLVVLTAIFWKGGKKEADLKVQHDAATNAYLSALWTEAASYGIDITSPITQRTQPLDEAYEITAMRHGVPVDITVREYNNGMLFMLNGQHMSKQEEVANELIEAAPRKWFGRS